MKLYNSITAETFVQDFGNSWLIVMQGPRNEVELLFNGFFNFGATDDPNYIWDDVSELGGTFFTTKERMTKFFEGYLENRYCNAGKSQEESIALAQKEAPALVEDLFLNHRQSRAPQQKAFDDGVYNFGTTNAEKPDDSFIDAVIANLNKIGMFVANDPELTPFDGITSEVEQMFSGYVDWQLN